LTAFGLPGRILAMKQMPLITLTTDFGTADGYVGTMKGVVLSIVPEAQLVDISHSIAPQDVRQAAYVLYTAYRFFPRHTVHLVVVDPGVGSVRRPVALRTPAGTFVGPDNGVFSYVMACEPVEALVELASPRYRLPEVSQTFHGRDVFSPAAAHLAAGVPIAALGPAVHNPITLPSPRLEMAANNATGEILHADHFGNVITSIGLLTWDGKHVSLVPTFQAGEGGRPIGARLQADKATVLIADQEIHGVHRTYADVEHGETLALVGSEGHLEIAVREGSAASKLNLESGQTVTLRW
jgi:S-adenosylmethionine hydrolase